MISEHKSLAVMIPERYSRLIYVHRHPQKYTCFFVVADAVEDCLAFKKSPTLMDTS